MKVGIMCHSSCGGSVRVATGLGKELARRGHRVHLFTRTTPFGHWGEADGVVLHRAAAHPDQDIHLATLYAEWPAHVFEAFLSLLCQVIKREGLDILHYHYAVPFAILAAEVKLRLKEEAPVLVGTLHGTDVGHYGRDIEKGPCLARALRELDGLTTVSLSHANLAVEVLGLERLPEVIPNFVDLAKFRPLSDQDGDKGEPKMKDREPERARIVHISNFRPVKNLQSMARIFINIRRGIDAELWLIGDGPEKDQLKGVLEAEGVKQDVHFMGLRRDVNDVLPRADLLLVSSLYESFCLGALEAMACGVPVLAPMVGGLPEVVVHGKTGFLFPPGDHGSAVSWVVNLLKDKIEHAAMRKAAAARAAWFEQARIVSIYEGLYGRLLSEKKPRCGLADDLPAWSRERMHLGCKRKA